MAAAKLPPGYGSNRRRTTGLKLWLGVVLVNLFGMFAAVWISSALRLGGGDPNVLLPVYYATMLVAGIIDAFWLDELVFHGGFRRSLFQGVGRLGKHADDREVEDMAATLQRPSVGFPLVVVFFSLASYGLFNLVNHGFDNWWRDIGKQAHLVRTSDDTAARIEAIRSLSLRNQPEVLDIFESQLTSTDTEVAAWAAWGLGRQRLASTMNSHRLAPLYDRVRRGPPNVRREALIALARLQHRPIADELGDLLTEELEGAEVVDIRLIWGLGYIQHPDSVEVLDKALYHPDPRVQRVAAWALGQQRDSGMAREAADLLEQRLPAAPIETKCAIIHSLGVLTDERSNLALMHAYQGATLVERETICTSEPIYGAPDLEDDREDILMPQDTFGMKTLQSMGGMRATTPQIRAEVEPWLATVIADETNGHILREAAQSLLDGIREARNDRIEKPAKP